MRESESSVTHTLSSKNWQGIKNKMFQGFESDWEALVMDGRLRLLEVCCSPDSVLTSTCETKFGAGSALRVSHLNGGDIETNEGRKHVKHLISEHRPQVVWFSPECGPYSPMQHLNMKTEKQRKDLQEKRAHAKLQYEGACELAMYTMSLGLDFVIELSERCEAWKMPCFVDLQKHTGACFGVCKGCQVGLKGSDGFLLGKGWKMLGSNHGLIRHMTLKCTTNHVHGKCEGSAACRASAFYTPAFAKRVIEHLQAGETMGEITKELMDGTDMQGHDRSMCHHQHVGSCNGEVLGTTEENPKSGDPKKKGQIMQMLRRIHSATGHCSKDYLLRALKRRNASSEVMEVAKGFRCPVCEEHRIPAPRNQSNLESIPPKWSRIQADAGTWVNPEDNRPFHFLVVIDEGSRFRMGKVLREGKKLSLTGEEFIQFFEEHWKPVFGNPSTVRLDPAGAFVSDQVDQYFSKRKIMLEHVPAESHWQIPLVERAIRTTKEMMNKLSSEFPEMKPQELFQRAVWAQNNRDQYLGFSPIQHVLGRSSNEMGQLHNQGTGDPPIITERGISAEFGEDEKAMKKAEELFVDEQYKQRIRRAQESVNRTLKVYYPGDLVFYWRKQLAGHKKEMGGQTFKNGAFLGPARVLATETRVDSDGEIRPGSCVWLYRGNRLLRASPQQLRPASEREEAWAELGLDKPIPWTITKILEDSKRKVYEDISAEIPTELTDMDLDLPAISKPAHRFRRKAPEVPAQRESVERPEKHPRQLDPEEMGEQGLIALASETPSTLLTTEESVLSVEIDLPSGKALKKKHWLRDLECYIVGQVKKNHIEVSEKRLTEEEKKQFDAAKQKEVKNYIMAEVFKQLPPDKLPDKNQVMKMRWILTWKFSKETSEKKAKARAVILGFQDPLYEYRPTASPTMTRTTRQIFLTYCAAYKFLVEKGDVSGAFLQGRTYSKDLFVEPLEEICHELKLPAGSVTKLTRAAYGLVEAPLEWYLTVDEFLTSIGFQRLKCDPCAWGYFDEKHRPIGWICGHVDDFLLEEMKTIPVGNRPKKLYERDFAGANGKREVFVNVEQKLSKEKISVLSSSNLSF